MLQGIKTHKNSIIDNNNLIYLKECYEQCNNNIALLYIGYRCK